MTGPNVVLPQGRASVVEPQFEYRYAFGIAKDEQHQFGLGALNKLLAEGWEPVRETPMGSTAGSPATLVLFRRPKVTQ